MSEVQSLGGVAHVYLILQAFDAFRRALEDSPSIPKTHVSGIYFNAQNRFVNQLAQTLRASGNELGLLVQQATSPPGTNPAPPQT